MPICPATAPTAPPAAEIATVSPYLVRVENGRAVVLDYGIAQGDGSWRLASDPGTAYASRDDILALAPATGVEWRSEAPGFNPLANVAVERIGVYFIDGQAVDYTVKVTDGEGSFFVWARNLDRAVSVQGVRARLSGGADERSSDRQRARL